MKTIHSISLFCCMAALALLNCNNPLDWNETDNDKPALSTTFTKQLQAVGEAYSKGDYTLHLVETRHLLTMSRRIPVIFLGPLEKLLLERVGQEGAGPYHSIIIDYIERYMQAPRDSTMDDFERFIRTVSEKIDLRNYENSFVMIPSPVERKEILYKENLGATLTKMATSRFGREQFRNGVTAHSFSRLIAAAYNCKKFKQDNIGYPNTVAQRSCEQLSQALEESMCGPQSKLGGECNQGKSNLALAMDYVNGGGVLGQLACFKQEDPYISQSSQFMEYVACQSQQSIGKSGISPYSIAGSNDHAPHVHGSDPIREFLEDATYHGYTESGYYPTEEGVTVQVQYSYTGADGSDIQVTETIYWQGDSWQNSPGQQSTVINVNNGNGSTTYSYDQDGTLVYAETSVPGENPVSTITTYHDNGEIKEQTVYNSNTDESTVTEYDDNGNVTKQHECATTKDEVNCSCTVGCDDPANNNDNTTPEFDLDPCYEQVYGRKATIRELRIIRSTDLGPWIQPDPEKIPVSELAKCLENMQAQPFAHCGPSAVLCLDDVDDACKCITYSMIPIFKGVTCSEINCGEGVGCDPGTGMCKTEEGIPFIGIHNPIPHF